MCVCVCLHSYNWCAQESIAHLCRWWIIFAMTLTCRKDHENYMKLQYIFWLGSCPLSVSSPSLGWFQPLWKLEIFRDFEIPKEWETKAKSPGINLLSKRSTNHNKSIFSYIQLQTPVQKLERCQTLRQTDIALARDPARPGHTLLGQVLNAAVSAMFCSDMPTKKNVEKHVG